MVNTEKLNQINKNITKLREEMSKGVTPKRKSEIQNELHILGKDILKASL